MNDIAMKLLPKIGEPISFDLIAGDDTDAFTGAETVTCHVKKALLNEKVPAKSAEIIYSVVPQFIDAAGDEPARWYFNVPPSIVRGLEPDVYITDALIEFSATDSVVPAPILIDLRQSVTHKAGS